MQLHTRDAAPRLGAWAERLATECEIAAEAVAAGNDLAALSAMTRALKTSLLTRDALVVELKQSGATWQQIGDALQTPRQVAWRKYKDACGSVPPYDGQ